MLVICDFSDYYVTSEALQSLMHKGGPRKSGYATSLRLAAALVSIGCVCWFPADHISGHLSLLSSHVAGPALWIKRGLM